mgnify:FL=1
MKRALADDAATRAFGASIASAWPRPLAGVIHLRGDLGAGKTTFAKGFLAELGVGGVVRSPTYTLVEPYDTTFGRVLHMDLYRLNDPEELEALGLSDDPPDQALWLVEWPQRGNGLLPAADLVIDLGPTSAAEGVGREAELRVQDRKIASIIEAIL